MTKRLYVGGLSYGTNNETLKNLFSQAGQVAWAKVITDQKTGRSKGFGFVEMKTDVEASLAVNILNETVFDDRTLTVIVAHLPQEREPGIG